VIQAKYDYYDLTNKNEHANVQLPYDTIEFRDVRYDTSFLAMVYPLVHISRTYNVKIDLRGGFARNVTSYFNQYYSTANSYANKSLVCYVKKFSITPEHDLLEYFNTGNLKDNVLNQVDIEIECYFRKGDSLFPAVRFDTSYTHHFSVPVLNPAEQIRRLLHPLMNKIEQVNLEHVEKRTSYTGTDIAKRYEQRFDIPILKASAYNKGVYRTFSEFRNNAPSIDSFSVSTDKLKVNESNMALFDPESLLWKEFQTKNTAIFLYDENRNLITPSEVFGYCDGTTIWIQHGAFFYPLERIGNAFEFMYVYHYVDSHLRTNTFFILTALNMETGHSN